MDMHPLGRLITGRMRLAQHRWVYNDVRTRMASAGRKPLSKSRLGQLINDPIESIKGEVVFTLADGLGVTPLTVANAALESMGIQTRPVEVTDSATTILIDPTLDERQRAELLALIREMRKRSTDSDVGRLSDKPKEGAPQIPPSFAPRGKKSRVLGGEDGQEGDQRGVR